MVKLIMKSSSVTLSVSNRAWYVKQPTTAAVTNSSYIKLAIQPMVKHSVIAYIIPPEEQKSRENIGQDFLQHSSVLCLVLVRQEFLIVSDLCAHMRNLASPILAITNSHDPNPISSLHRHLFLINSIRIQLLCSDQSIYPSPLPPHQSCAPHLTFSWFHSFILHKRSTGTDTSRLSKATT